MVKKGIRAGVVILCLIYLLLCSIGVNAEEGYTVTQTKAILYSIGNGATVVYSSPDLSSQVITTLDANYPVQVFGVTSNGWFQVDIEGMYFIPGSGLKGTCDAEPVITYKESDIERLTKGTFSFFSSKQLKAYTKEEIEEMDENTYIKYLDSFLIGNAVIDYCIIRDNSLTLKSHYEGLAACDEKVKAMSMRQYLLNYRMEYLEESLKGPIRNEKSLKQLLTRAIRYEKNSFRTIYKNVGIGSNKGQMEEILTELIDTVRYEQGIIYSYKMEYGSYTTATGKESSGWLIDFSY